jgi:ferredoxin
MKVQIDRALCNGHAMCFRTTPEVFVLDSDGFGFIREGMEDVPQELEESVRNAVLNCPEGAVSVSED